MNPCLLCGKPTGEFIGLCDPCCRLIKVKNDAFVRQSRERLEKAKALEDIIVRDYGPLI